jgi:hypothetical protein
LGLVEILDVRGDEFMVFEEDWPASDAFFHVPMLPSLGVDYWTWVLEFIGGGITSK